MGYSFFPKRKRGRYTNGRVGLCFHTHGISIAHVQRDKGQVVRLLACDFVSTDAATDKATALKTLVNKHNLAKLPCVLALEPGGYSLLQVEAPRVEPSEMRAAVQWKIRDLIDFPLQDAVTDVFAVPGLDERARAEKMIYVVAANANRIQERTNAIHASGLDLQAIDISELCLRNIAASTDMGQAGVAFLYFMRNEGMLILSRGNVLYLARNMDTGIDIFRRQGPQQTAGANALDMQNPVHDTIALELQRSLDYFESYFAQPSITNLLIAPADSSLAALADDTARNLGIDAQLLDLSSFLKPVDGIDISTRQQDLIAIGAALRNDGDQS